MKIALISGGTSGIGKATVKQLLEEGYGVATFSRNREKCKSLENDLKNENLLVANADVTKENDMNNIVNQTLNKFQKIDILINNAGFGALGLFYSIIFSKIHPDHG